jgi:uncharacterized protein YecE (DUF72 family)
MRKIGSIFIGTSGWSYKHWKGTFYPDDLSSKLWREYYSQLFRSVELNNPFYHLPREETFQKWHDSSPKGFIFAVKASRYITHMKKLKDAGSAVKLLLERVRLLDEKLGPILFQLPPKLELDPERLSHFLGMLPSGFRYTFEFRNPSWFDSRVEGILSDHAVAFCIYHLAGRLSPIAVTTDFVYIRLHGPKGPYQGRYEEESLKSWGGQITEWSGQGKDVYCYFDNDEKGYAAHDAIRLQQIISEEQSGVSIPYNERAGSAG